MNFQKQNGNALFLILLAVALFAALSYAITQSGRGSGNANKEQTALKAARLIQYMGSLQAAINRMVLMGTAPSAIQFYSAGTTPCTTGANCVFAPDGGGVTFLDWQNFVDSAPSYMIFFPAGAGAFVQGVGSASDEVLMVITGGPQFVVKDICPVINTQLGLPLAGSLPNNQPFNVASPPFTIDSMPGVLGGCGREDSGTNYVFYWVLYPG